jgi:hypothetical protein
MLEYQAVERHHSTDMRAGAEAIRRVLTVDQSDMLKDKIQTTMLTDGD